MTGMYTRGNGQLLGTPYIGILYLDQATLASTNPGLNGYNLRYSMKSNGPLVDLGSLT